METNELKIESEKTNNVFLNEIVNLVSKYYEESKIVDDDLETLSKAFYTVTNKSMKADFLSTIPSQQARNMLTRYDLDFGNDMCFDKKFIINFKLIENLVNAGKGLKVTFTQIGKELHLVYNDENGIPCLLINKDDSIPLDVDAVLSLSNNFKNRDYGLKRKLDDYIYVRSRGAYAENTNHVTIPHKDLDEFRIKGQTYIALCPAIDEDTVDLERKHRLTMVMYFEDQNSRPANDVYYDEFCLNPPKTC